MSSQDQPAAPSVPPRIWEVHARGYPRQALGYRVQGALGGRAQHEAEVRLPTITILLRPNQLCRRCIAKDHMLSNEYPITLTTFPRLGSPGVFTEPYYPPSGSRLR